jgi:hypothetical protein
MKKMKLLFMMLMALFAIGSLSAEEVAPYTCDFETAISTSDHDFKVASNWSHIAGYVNDYGTWYMSYTYYSTGGNPNGYLMAYAQEAGYPGDTAQSLTDLLVTPPVKGTVTLDVNPDKSASYVEVYSINDDGSKGSLIKTVKQSEMGSTSAWSTITLAEDLADYQKLGLRCYRVGLDNFTATSANIEPQKGLTVVSVSPTAYTKWPQQADGTVHMTYTVTVQNTGEVDLVENEDNFTVSVIRRTDNNKAFTVYVPCSLAVGETSDPFTVDGYADVSDIWGTSTGSVAVDIMENVTGTTKQVHYCVYNPYEPKFVFRASGSTSSSSLSDAVSLGAVEQNADAPSLEYEFYNDGAAPLTIKSVTLPEWLNATVKLSDDAEPVSCPDEGFTVEAGSKVPFTVTMPTENIGDYSGNLQVVYLDKNAAEQTYSLAFSGKVYSADTWVWDFGSESAAKYPEGSLAFGGVSSAYSSSEGHDYFISAAQNNAYFITPLLGAKEGDTISFDVAGYSTYSNGSCNVYITKDRYNWGEPVFSETGYTKRSSTYSTPVFASKSVNFAEKGEYYVVFEFPNAALDNIYGPKPVEVAHDLFVKADTGEPTSIQSGATYTHTATVMPAIGELAIDYTIALCVGDDVVATAESVDLPTNAKTEKDIKISWTPTVETTTTFEPYIKITYSDNSSSVYPIRKVTVENEPYLVFLDGSASTTSVKKDGSLKTAISFGTTNEVSPTKMYKIYNYGTAPLQVTAVRVPDGFSVDVTSCTVASKESQDLTLTLSATEPSTYSGNLEIDWVNVSGETETYVIGVSGTLLDASKWYTEFAQSGTSFSEWPAGTVHETGLSGTLSSGVAYIYNTNGTNNMLITPKLSVEKGDELMLNAANYSTSWKDGYIKVYLSETREGLSSDETRTLMGELSYTAEDEDFQLTSTDWKDYVLEFPEDGEFYMGVMVYDSKLHSIYGGELVEVAHDLMLSATSIPESAVQNTAKKMSVSVLNFGLAPETADSYKVEAYVNGEKVAESEGVDVPVSYTYSASATTIPVSVRYPKVGTFSVYLQLVAGEEVLLASDPVDVTFAEETLSAEKQVGEYSKTAGYSEAPLNFNYYTSESLIMYTAEDLGLSGGEKISKIYMKGYDTITNFPISFKLAYKWTDETTLTTPSGSSTTPYDLESAEMIVIKNEDNYNLPIVGSASETEEFITYEFDEPLVYESGKSLVLYVYGKGTSWKSSGYGVDITADKTNAQRKNWDSYSASWTAICKPVLYLSLDVEPTTLSGVVTEDGAVAEGAVVTLVSTDGDNVQYEGVADSEGNYSINVIQSSRNYDVTATKDAKLDYAFDQKFEGNAVQDFTLMDYMNLSAETGNTAASELAIVDLDLQTKTGYNAVALPIELTEAEATELFGEGFEVLTYSTSDVDGDVLHAYFRQPTSRSGLLAGSPYIIKATKDAEPTRYRGKAVSKGAWNEADGTVAFTGTFVPKYVEKGEFFLTEDNFVTVSAKAREAEVIPAYTAYLKVGDAAVTSVDWAENVASGVTMISAEDITDADQLYSLQGFRVKNPTRGIYILNGKKVFVAK